MFTDGTNARFSAVEFLPDGRLKASVTTCVTVAYKEHHVTDVTYYAAGSWESVQEPVRGVIIGLIIGKYPHRGGQARDAHQQREVRDSHISGPLARTVPNGQTARVITHRPHCDRSERQCRFQTRQTGVGCGGGARAPMHAREH
ncbi:hypothetical protein [Mycolicibacterium sp.]|uniref:hypothetical protein n=1 Tax=Mycolicibacterium sp. TaxID=2320850 RepID=UPI0037C53A14